MNTVSLIGRITTQPETKNTAEGKPYTKFIVAVDKGLSKEKREEYEAQGKETAEFPRIVVWGKKAVTICDYMKKGQNIGITGRLSTRRWIKEDGTRAYLTEVVATKVNLFLENSKSSEGIETESCEKEGTDEKVPF